MSWDAGEMVSKEHSWGENGAALAPPLGWRSLALEVDILHQVHYLTYRLPETQQMHPKPYQLARIL